MDTIPIDILELADIFRVLEASLLHWQFLDIGIWPADEWEDHQIRLFADLLHLQTHICLARQLERRPPRFIAYASDPSVWVSRRELIRLTGALLNYFAAAPVRLNETLLITLLEHVHNALIGAHYFRRPSETTSRVIRFR